MDNPYVIADVPGFSPQIARLVCMMNYARRTTLEMVNMLTQDELDHIPAPYTNSIGMLLAHIAAVEVDFQALTFENRKLTPEEETPLLAALDLGANAHKTLRGKPIGHYLQSLAEVRAKTLREFATRDDAWLEETFPFWGDTGNRAFCWFHAMEDEINHRGQIRLLHKHLPRLQHPGRLGLSTKATHNGLGLTLCEITPGGAAEKAGLKAGDVILSLDDTDISRTPHDHISLFGVAGSTLRFVLQRQGQDTPLELVAVRAART